MNFADRIKSLRTSHNLTSKQMAEIFGVDVTTISKWEQAGIIPNGKTLEKICDYFHISMDYLFGRSETRSVLRESRRLLEVKVCQNEKPFVSRMICYADMTPDSLNESDENDFFIITVLDDAMQPLIYPTDMLLIRCSEFAESGDLVFLTPDDKSEGIVRKLIYNDGILELHSVNPYYPVKKIKDTRNVKIYGVVKQLTRKFMEDQLNGKFQHEKI